MKVSGRPTFFESLRNKKRVRYLVKSAIIITKKKFISETDLFSIIRVRTGTQVLGNFPPTIAKAVYEHYCGKNARILDFSAGFGGRLVGAMSSGNNYNYVGVDPSLRAVKALNKLIKFLNLNKDVTKALIIQKPFEESDKDLLDNHFDFAFSSPPYFNKENYGSEKTQSHIKFHTIEKWQNGFLLESFKIIRRKLKDGKYLLVNIADIKDHSAKNKKKIIPLEHITIKMCEKAGFKYRGFHKILINNRKQSINVKRDCYNPIKYEKIFIFKK